MALSSTQIKKRLRENGLNMAEIARRAGVSPTTVWKQVHKARGAKSGPVREVIARAIDMECEEVFGEVA